MNNLLEKIESWMKEEYDGSWDLPSGSRFGVRFNNAAGLLVLLVLFVLYVLAVRAF